MDPTVTAAAIGVGGTVVVGVAGFSAASWTTRKTIAHARESRLWDRRADTYVAMLQYQGGGMAEGYQGPRTASEWAVRDELTAKVAAFATDEVRELWRQSALASLNLDEYVTEDWPQWSAAEGYGRQELEDRMEKDEAFRRFRQASTDAARRLDDQIPRRTRYWSPRSRPAPAAAVEHGYPR